MRSFFLPALAVAIAAVAGAAHAQDLTDEELLRRFEAQRTAYQDVLQNGQSRGIGIRRSLSILTEEDVNDPDNPANPINPVDPNAPPTVFDPSIVVDIRVEFETDSFEIQSSEVAELERICRLLPQMTPARFRIVGHTDSVGSVAHNLQLSRNRAEAVATYLADACPDAVAPIQNLEVMGYGERFPLIQTPQPERENRRVEFQLLG